MDNIKLPPYFPSNKAICVANTFDFEKGWIDKFGNDVAGPSYGEEVTILKIIWDSNENDWSLVLKEYSPNDEGYIWTSFAPIQESPFPSLTMKQVVEKESVLTSLN